MAWASGGFSLAADIEEQRGKWKDALRDRRKAVELDPRNAGAVSSLIDIYISLRRYPEAERELDRALASMPLQTAGPIFRQKSKVARGRGDAKAARAALDAHPMRKNGLVDLTLLLAETAMMDRDYAEAAQLIESIPEVARARDALPKEGLNAFHRGRVLKLLGTVFRAQGQTEKARATFGTARSSFVTWRETHDPASEHYPTALAFIAECDAGLARKEDAIREARAAVTGWPLSRDALVAPEMATRLAIVYAWTGERDAAIEQLTSLVKLPAGLSAGDLKLNPVWDDLRSDPRFDALIAAAAEPASFE